MFISQYTLRSLVVYCQEQDMPYEDSCVFEMHFVALKRDNGWHELAPKMPKICCVARTVPLQCHGGCTPSLHSLCAQG